MIINVPVFCTHYSCQVLIKLELSRQIFENYSNIKFHENSSTVSRVVPCGRIDGRTDMKLIVYFPTFAKAPKKWPDVRSHHALCLEHAVCRLLFLYSSVSVYTQRKFPNVYLCFRSCTVHLDIMKVFLFTN